MTKLSFDDITNRQRSLLYDNPKCTMNVEQVYNSVQENYSFPKAKIVLEHWTELGDEETALNKVMTLYNTIIDNDTDSNIKTATNIIESNVIKKLRNADQTNKLVHYKQGWIKHRHTSMLNDTKDNETAVSRAKANGGLLGNSLHPNRKYKRDIYGRKMQPIEKKNDEQAQQQEEEIKECFDRFIETSIINVNCDRVLNNHNKLSKRFDFDKIARQCKYPNDITIQESICNICQLIDTYDIPNGVKYAIALENTMYLMNKNLVNVSNKTIANTVTDYFLLKESEDIQSVINNINFYTEKSAFFTESDFEDIAYLKLEDEQAMIEAFANEDETIINIEENKIHDMFLKYKEKREMSKKKKQELDSMNIKKVMHDFKKSNNKTEETFKAAISRIFVQSPEGIINELPDIFEFVRLGVVIGTLALNPFLGIITMITGFFLKMKVSRERMEVVVDKYTKERDKYKTKLNEAKAEKNEKKIAKYDALYKEFKKDVEKLEAYQDTLYTEEENDKRMEEKWAKEAEKNGGDDFNFEFEDFNFDESTAIETVGMLATLYEQMNDSKYDLTTAIKKNIPNLNSDDIFNISEAINACCDIVDCNRVVAIFEDERVRSKACDSYLISTQKSDTLTQCIGKLNEVKYNSLLLTESVTEDDESLPDIVSVYETMKAKNELVQDIISYVNESSEGKGMSFLSKLKIGAENLRRIGNKAKDKDKQLSMKLDSELNRAAKSAKKAMISDSRESIIKGSFLPSASKCIHIALASGAGWMISPVMTIIGLLGYFGTSKVATEKERNLILDDIEIEIKMCDKYLKLAEDKDDLVAVREILKTKRDLERQRARILYNKNYVFKGKKQYDMKPASMSKNDED